jgi:hypothetical protein
MIQKQEILNFILQKGPTLTPDIVSEFNSDSFIVGAYLSELSKENKLKISHLKIGSSALYYLPEQKQLLENFSDNLHPKQKIIYEQLKKERVIREDELEPALRVALRELKDFSVPIEIKLKDRKIIFYRYYLVDSETSKQLISNKLKDELSQLKTKKTNEFEENKQLKDTKEDNKRFIQKREEQVTYNNNISSNNYKSDNENSKIIKQRQVQENEQKTLKQYSNIDSIGENLKYNEIKSILEFLKTKINFEEFENKKSPYFGKTSINSSLGKIKFFCAIYDNKKITEKQGFESISLALKENLPCMIITKEIPNTVKKNLWENFENLKLIDTYYIKHLKTN